MKHTEGVVGGQGRVPNRTAGGLRLPDFFIVGAPKCGTTTLYQYLLRHPGVFMSTPKEMSFFSKPEVYERGFDWYCGLFAGAGEGQVCGEASTTYARWPTYTGVADRMVEAVPTARLVYLVRNPVDRVYSFYSHRMRDRQACDIDEFLSSTPEAIHSGRYMSQVDELLRRFPRGQLHVMLLEDLRANCAEELDRLRRFLGLAEFNFETERAIVANPGNGHFSATQRLTRLAGAAKRVPVLGPALSLAPPSLRQRVFRWLQAGPVGRRLKTRHMAGLTPLTPALRERLYDLFTEDVERFEAFLERDLSYWKESVDEDGHREEPKP